MDNSFEIDGAEFKVRKINAIKQFHIARRMAPMLAELTPAFKGIAKVETDAKKSGKELSEEDKFDRFAEILGPVLIGASKISEEDSEKILLGLLEAVEIKHMGSFAQVVRDNRLMIDTIELPTMLKCAAKAFMFNISGFFKGPLPKALG